jgi:hypothetical protein
MRDLPADSERRRGSGEPGWWPPGKGSLLGVAGVALLGAAVLVSLLLLESPTSAAATTTLPAGRGSDALDIGHSDRLVVQQLHDGTRCVILVGPNRGGVDCDWQRKGG